jgi:diaminopimelate epimerase
MEFSKYEAAANDFIMLDRMSGGPPTDAATVAKLCDRCRGIGADGVIELLPSDACDARMRIVNADGSEAEMCGNGIRALFLFALDQGILGSDEAIFETAAGEVRVARVAAARPPALFAVELGEPSFARGRVPMRGEADEEAVGVSLSIKGLPEQEVTCLSMGNPHCVIFVDDLDGAPVDVMGPAVEHNEAFPERTNVEFVRVIDRNTVEARVWERGVGETMACGTGACASVAAACMNGLTDRSASVRLPGGELEITWHESGVRLVGPARHVFDGKTVE